MNTKDAVSREIRRIALGSLVLTALMLIVFVLLGRTEAAVWFGALYGYVLANGNFMMLAHTVRKITDNAENADEDTTKMAKMRMQKSYSTRMLVGVILLIAALAVFKLNWVTCCLPLIFPRIIILFKSAFDRMKRVKGSDIK